MDLLLIGAVVMAELPLRDQPPTPRAGTGVIRGRVVGADTGEPLRRVEVRVDEWSTKDLGGPAAVDHHLPHGHCVVAKPILAGLHHESRLEPLAA